MWAVWYGKWDVTGADVVEYLCPTNNGRREMGDQAIGARTECQVVHASPFAAVLVLDV